MNVADPETTFSFAITVDDKAIGSIAAFRQSNIHSKTAEVGYYIAEGFIYGNWVAPVTSIPGNLVQIGVAAVLVLPIAEVVRRAIRR